MSMRLAKLTSALACLLPASVTSAAAHLSPAARARAESSGRVARTVIAALDTRDTARVIVSFALPGAVRPHELPAARRRAAIANARATIVAAVPQSDLRVTHTYEAVDAFAGEVSAEGVLALLDRPEVVRIREDAIIHAELNESLPLTKISDVKAMGYTGQGVVVAVLDTGIDTDHPDLADDIADEACFCVGCCPGGASGPGAAEDDNGHGTEVAGIITSGGTQAPEGGAPDATIVAVKVLDAFGAGFASDAINGLDWIIVNHPEVKVVNMSLGSASIEPGDCDTGFTGEPYASAVETLRANGAITFAASGNDGSGAGMNIPACVSAVVSVGAVWDQNTGDCNGPAFPDDVACYSNSGPTTDLFAPGGYITTTQLGGGMTTGYGTSFASPIAAACAADLLQAKPWLRPKEIEVALKASPTLVTDPKNGLSFPRVDCLDALGVAGIETHHLIGGQTTITPGKLVKFLAKGSFTLPDREVDDPLLEGGSLRFQGTTGGQTYSLPATCWKAFGPGGDGSKGYKCKGAPECKIVIVKPKVIKGLCKTLDTGDFGPLPEPGPVDIVFTVGTGTKYCAECGGTPKGNPDDTFKRTACAAPLACP